MRRASVVAAALLASAVAGCASTSNVADPIPPGGIGGPPPASGNPADLVGSWHLDAPGEPAGAIVTIGDRVDGGLLLFHRCGMLSGSWRANRHAMFVGSLDGGDGSCFGEPADTSVLTPHWLTAAVAFARSGRNETLLDARGAVLATLRPGAHPTVGSNDSPDYVKPPAVTAQMRDSWREPAALPSGVRPVTLPELLHRWVPVGHRGSRAYVTFLATGRYDGSDGCNRSGGRYLLGEQGILLATSGPSTLIGCENDPLPGWVAQSGRLGLRAGRLVFVSPAGKALGEAVLAR